MVHSTGRLRAVDLVEVNPLRAKDDEEVKRTVAAAGTVLMAALGHSRAPPF